MNKLIEISKIARNMNVYYRNILGNEDMSSNTYESLRLAVKHPGINSNYISNRLNLDKGLVSRIVRSLVKQGFFVTEEDENDKRSKKIYPTQKAIDLKAKKDQQRDEYYGYIEQFIPDGEKDRFFEVLDTLYEKSRELRHNKFQELNHERDKDR